MKILTLWAFLTCLLPAFSFGQDDPMILQQRFSIYRPYFEQNGIALANYDFRDSTINSQLFSVLKYNQKRTNQITRSIVFGVMGTALLVGGVSHHPAKGIDGLFDFTKPGLIALSIIPYTVCAINLSNIGSTNKKIEERLVTSRKLLMR